MLCAAHGLAANQHTVSSTNQLPSRRVHHHPYLTPCRPHPVSQVPALSEDGPLLLSPAMPRHLKVTGTEALYTRAKRQWCALALRGDRQIGNAKPAKVFVRSVCGSTHFQHRRCPCIIYSIHLTSHLLSCVVFSVSKKPRNHLPFLSLRASSVSTAFV